MKGAASMHCAVNFSSATPRSASLAGSILHSFMLREMCVAKAHLVVDERLLGQDVAQHHGHVGDHCVVEAVPREADLRSSKHCGQRE